MSKKTKIKQTIHNILIAISVVFFWRGAWGLMDLYLFPGNSTLSFIVSLLIGLVVLLISESVEKLK